MEVPLVGTRVAVMQFAMKPELLQPWTADKSEVEKVLQKKMLSGKSSRLADAFAAAAAQFKDTAPGTRHIVVVSDGVDTPGGKITMAAALKQETAIISESHTAAPGEKSAAAAACAIVSCLATSVSGRAYT